MYHALIHLFQFFTKNGEPTLVTKDPAFQDVIGHQSSLSFNDVKAANIVYQCGGKQELLTFVKQQHTRWLVLL